MSGVEIRLLGPLEAVRDGAIVRLGGTKQRSVLAVLALNSGHVVSSDRLVSALWGDEPPSTATTALQGHVSRLRRLLGQEVILTRAPGYVLDAPTDVSLFERLLRDGDHRGALELWRGAPLSDLAAGVGLDVTDGIHRLDEQRLWAQEELFDADLRAGRHSELIPVLEDFTREQPLRERPVGQLMLALYRSGRQAESLAAYRRFRLRLRDELGLEPREPLRALQRRILEQDPALAPPRAASDRRDRSGRRTPISVVAVGIEAAPAERGEPDAEAYEHVVSRAREASRLALEHHGGSVQGPAGAGLLAFFGVPSPREDDAVRAVRAAREAIDAVAASADELSRYGLAVSARAGVASGEAFGGHTPASERALRLQAEAEAGGMLADDATLARGHGRELLLDRPLSGRTREQKGLRESYEGVLGERRSSLVAIVGPAGIGKSRLAADLLDSIPANTRILYTRCLSYGDGVSFLPAIDLVNAAAELSPKVTREQAGERFAELIGDDAGTVEQLLRLVGLGDGPGEDDETVLAVRRLLEGVAGRSPVVVLVDDLHWASPATLDLVERLAEPMPAPLLVVATTREAPRESLAAAVLELEPIDADACADMTANLLGTDAVAPDTLSALVEHSGGNPLFLEELVLELRAEGRLHETDGGWRLDRGDLPAPRSIESLLASRLERLPDRERDVLLTASVIGRSFAPGAVEELVGHPIEEEIASLRSAGLVGPSRFDGLDFHHLLIRDAAYASLPLERRAELHRRHADWIVRSAIAAPLEREALAFYHHDQSLQALEALAPGDPRVKAESEPLGARAASLGRALLNRGDAASSAAVLARALDLGFGDPHLPVDLGRAHFDVGDFEAADQAFAVAGDGPAADRARLGTLEVAMRTEPAVDLAAAKAQIDRIRSALEQNGDTNGLAEAWLASAYLAVVRGNAAELVELLEQALAFARRSGRPRVETWILFLVCGACWYGPMRVPDGINRCEQVRSEALGRPGVEAAALQSLAVLHAMNGEPDEARRLVAASRSIRRELGQEIGAAASAIDEGLVELMAGDDVRAERTLRGGHDELKRIGEKGYFSTVTCLLGEAVIGQGRVEEARALAREAAEAATEDDVASQVGWRVVEARALAGEGRHDEAEELAREGARRADATDFLFLQSEAWAALADVHRARNESAAEGEARQRARSLMERKGCAQSAVEAWTRPR